ncbi:hypothetical protein F8388_023237 [Cannabis sativa]|uniref:RNase H type-1 domain-containing protein n=1 Tax=Cannabis sativa TaxID=3483 RepID=A0A7J6HDL6_CANSA|nr:hypothetical protein F8388_023237 [Cannabis sativa]
MGEEEKFLGNPMFVRANRNNSFKFVVDKVSSRFEGWKAKLLSQSARTVLINSVIQGMPQYTMSVFKLPTATLSKLDKMARQFWWKGETDGGRFLALVAWDNICKTKACGGLGLREANDINVCFLAKLAWCLASNSDSLWSQFLKGKYYPSSTFLESELRSNASMVARGIWAVKPMIADNSAWRVCPQSDKNIWKGNWILFYSIGISVGEVNSRVQERITLKNLIREETLKWDFNMIRNVFVSTAVDKFRMVNPVDMALEDCLIWTPETNGIFSIKSAYWKLNASHFVLSDFFKDLWKSSIHPRHKLFLWKTAKGALPTGDRIESFNFRSGLELVQWIIRAPFLGLSQSDEKLMEFQIYAACLVHNVWGFRNHAFHHQSVLPLVEMKKCIDNDFASHWKEVLSHVVDRSLDESSRTTSGAVVEDCEGLLVFVDATVKNGEAAIGVVVKNEARQLQALYACKVSAVSALHGELSAILKGLEVVEKLNVRKGTLFSDCQSLTKAVEK